MGVLDLLNRATLSGGVNPSVNYSQRANGRNLTSTADLAAAASTGFALRNPFVGRTRYTDNMPVSMGTSRLGTGEITTDSRYINSTSGDVRGSRLGTNAGSYGSTYADKIFAQNIRGTNQPSNLVTSLRQSTAVVTPVGKVGTPSGMPLDDGRYDITMGFGFILYTQDNYS